MSYLKKLKQAKVHETINNNDNKEDEVSNESFEARYIKEMNNDIEEAFERKGEEIGMNEMCNNVIDNITSGKEVSELFQMPGRRKSVRMTNKLPKLSIIKDKEKEDKKSGLLYSERFIKPSRKNYKELLILPLIRHKYKCDQNIKFKQGETEKILAYEYYQNSYRKCVQLTKSQKSLNAVRENYKMMWDYVNTYKDKKIRERTKSKVY